jgi:hypothetical protein
MMVDDNEKRPTVSNEPFKVVANTTDVAEQNISNIPVKHKRIMRGDKFLMQLVIDNAAPKPEE